MNFKLLRTACVRSFLAAALLGAAGSTSLWAKEAKALHYLKAGHPNAVELLAPPPLPGSSEQAADLALVISVTKTCSSNEVAQGFAEKHFSLFTFTPAIGNFVLPGKLPRTEAFLERVQEDAGSVVDEAKNYWKQPRPYTLKPSLAAGKLEKSYSYPSGHSTESMVLALVLAELFPDRQEAILQVARNIGWHRVCIGRHYLTDIYAGRTLAQAILRELKASPAFEHDLAEVKAEVGSARR